MKFYAYFREDGTVDYAHSFEALKPHTEEEIYEKVKECNDREGREAFVVFEAEGKLEEVINYLLGDKGYKRYADLDKLDTSINELSSDIRSIYDDAFSMNESIERIEKMFDEFKEKFENFK